jgi:phage repressor protein C with HTH and peptisase S24 domain
MTEHQRLKEVRRKLYLSQQDLAESIGRKQGTISDIERGKCLVDGIAPILNLKYNVNIAWLKHGEGKMFLVEHESATGVPYFDIDVAGMQADFSLMEEKPEYFVDYRPFNDCNAYLPVYGDSMYPRFASGEIVAVKQVSNVEVILWGEAYLVFTGFDANQMKTIKLLFEHHDADKIILRSSNPNYRGDTVIRRKSITGLYLIKGKITRSQI